MVRRDFIIFKLTMVFKIERRLDFYIIFRAYCEMKLEYFDSNNTVGFTKSFDFFYYSRWQNRASIEEALNRLNNNREFQGISFDVKESDIDLKIKITINKPLLEQCIEKYLSKIKHSKFLKHADNEDVNECNKVLPFYQQRDKMTQLLRTYYFQEGSNIEFKRLDLNEIENNTPYNRYCFEELLLILQMEDILEINKIYTKELKDENTNKLVAVPVVVINYKNIINCGRLNYDRYKNSILLDDKILLKPKPKAKTVKNLITINFLKILIAANGNFVPTKKINHDMLVGVITGDKQKGNSYKAKKIFHSLKQSHPEIAVFVEAHKQSNDSGGYRIRRG